MTFTVALFPNAHQTSAEIFFDDKHLDVFSKCPQNGSRESLHPMHSCVFPKMHTKRQQTKAVQNDILLGLFSAPIIFSYDRDRNNILQHELWCYSQNAHKTAAENHFVTYTPVFFPRCIWKGNRQKYVMTTSLWVLFIKST